VKLSEYEKPQQMEGRNMNKIKNRGKDKDNTKKWGDVFERVIIIF